MANLFAQNSANWDSANMWNTVANGSGSYVTPGASDVCMANGKTVTVNISPTVSQVRNDTTGSATAGGYFDLANGITLTATVYGGNTQPTGVGCVQCNLASPNSASAVGGGYPGTSGAAVSSAYSHNGTGTLSITGNLSWQGGSSLSGSNRAVYHNSLGTLNITGNVTGGPGSGGQRGGETAAAGISNLTGVLTAGTGSTAYGWYANNVAATITVTGDVNGGGTDSTGHGYHCQAVTTITGTMTANAGAAVYLTGAAANRCIGAINSSNNASGILTVATTFCDVTGPGTQTNVSYPPITGLWRLDSTTDQTYFEFIDSLGTKRTLYTTGYNVGGLPSVGNVRSGTTFGPSNELTGTLAVPPAASVAYGVPVDATTGTAAITAATISAAVWDTLVADLDTANSIGARLAQAATVPSTGAQIAALGV